MKPAWILAALVSLTAFAGCLAADDKSGDADPTPPAWTLVDSMPKIDAKTMLAEHKDFVTKFPQRYNNLQGHKDAREFLAKEFNASGLEVYRLKFTAGIAQEDICGIVWGHSREEWVVVGGHYDTTTWDAATAAGTGQAVGGIVSQGAYDDGSGTRITVALAKAFAKTKPYYSIIFCAFDGEERGLQGSKALFDAMKGGKFHPAGFGDNESYNSTRGMLDLDMFGINWPARAPINFDNNAPALQDAVDVKRKALGIPDDMIIYGGISLGQSDYAHWMKADIPTGFFISDFEGGMVPVPGGAPDPVPPVLPTYPWWHWMDTYDTMEAQAGGPQVLQAGFQNAIDLSETVLEVLAFHPEIKLSDQTE